MSDTIRMVYSDLMEATLEHDVRPAVRRLSACVEKNAARLGGEPVFRGTRVPVKSLFDHLSAGDSVETFLDDFPGITRKQVQTALEAAGVYLDSVPNGRGQA